jgi:prepilin-type N-terminal cleavage/methylation domain-containing protein
MTSQSLARPAGFTLIEVLICVLIIGILASVAIPQYFKTIERDKASEAVSVMQALKSAQDRYWAKYGGYCNAAISSCSGFDYDPPSLKYYNAMPAFAAGSAGNQSWTLVLTRKDTPALYGQYHLTYDIEPNAGPKMTCDNASCQTDLIPK